MSEGRYRFLPWLRRGISALASSPAEVSISFGQGRAAQASLALASPADIIGLDSRVVSRTWPEADTDEAEPNLFPLVELDQPDLPWRYSPEAPAGDRLRPWIVLLVVADTEITAQVPAGRTRPLPVVSLNAPLPSLEQSWAWVHVQVTEIDGEPNDLEQLLEQHPHRVIARLLSPRRMEPKTRYTALLVPAFETGRRAGLGESSAAVGEPAQPAWAQGTDAIDLPVYHRWSFTTGERGDFQQLAQRLGPAGLGAVGAVPMDVSQPGGDLPAAASEPMLLEGALRLPGSSPSDWPEAERTAFVGVLAEWLNRAADLIQDGEGDRVVSPPLYGRWHATEDRLQDGQAPRWFNELNADPRLRAAAGLGAEVIRREQRSLMHAAWRQLDGITEVNAALAAAQLAREVSGSLHRRHLDGADIDGTLAVSAPVLRRLRASPTTIAAEIGQSPVPDQSTSAVFRAITRPLGAVGRRQQRELAKTTELMDRLNRGDIDPAPEASGDPVPEEPIDPAPGEREPGDPPVPPGRAPIPPGRAPIPPGRPVPPRRPPVPPGGSRRRAVPPHAANRRPSREVLSKGKLETVWDPTSPPPPPPKLRLQESVAVGGSPSSRPAEPEEALAFRDAASALIGELAASRPATPPPLRPLALTELSKHIVSSMDPRETIERTVSRRLGVAEELQWEPDDPLEPVLAGPQIDQAMCQPLVDLSRHWLLPGAEGVPANSVALLETNQRFVEAYMAGLNHEMGRELLWREYPTHPRKTYFQTFWDSGTAGANGSTHDIDPIHTWDPKSPLGGHRPAGQPGDQLVLLIRGDIVHRYRRLQVYAVHAVWSQDPRVPPRTPGDQELSPVFSGRLGLDMSFFGFALTYAEARGSGRGAGEGDPGWYFAIAERIGEPRFGLDAGTPDGPARAWNQLAWSHLTGDAQPVHYVDLDAPLPDTSFVGDRQGAAWHGSAVRSADTAFITLRQPFRVLFHARDLLPELDA